jgi:transposase
MVHLIEDLAEDWRRLDERIERLTAQIEKLARGDADCRRLMGIPGVGPLIASTMVAAIGNGAAFGRGRDFGAWLGLVPKQISTGDRTILGGISRRGNTYLRSLFVQGARAVLLRPESWARYGFGCWLTTAARRLHRNVLAVALANKLARIAWGVLHGGRDYDAAIHARAA